PYEVVLADSRRFSRSRRYLGSLPEAARLSRTGLLPSVERLSRTLPLDGSFVTRSRIRCCRCRSHYPDLATPPGFTTKSVWAGPLSLAATQGVACCFLFLGVLRCFNSPGSLYRPYVFRPE